ncbi:hypothetical protein ACFOEK_09005 [Litoribrevibacter euphylliae]|uniref:Uncharacterized protein n=1 Tax=Litoribrevibacter euphylliae TaxID=1834034 RepID=A0ABV7HI00_9GAMM
MSVDFQFMQTQESQGEDQRNRIINALEVEIKHFTKAMNAIKSLPSSHDQTMGDAYDAYCKMISAYQEMINVRTGIIERLKSPVPN